MFIVLVSTGGRLTPAHWRMGVGFLATVRVIGPSLEMGPALPCKRLGLRQAYHCGNLAVHEIQDDEGHCCVSCKQSPQLILLAGDGVRSNGQWPSNEELPIYTKMAVG